MKMNKKWFLILLTIVAIAFSACSSKGSGDDNENAIDKGKDNVEESGMPIVDDELTLDIFTARLNAGGDFNESLMWNKYDDETNIETNWEHVDNEAIEEKRNLAMQHEDDLPDVFYTADFSTSDVYKYGKQGEFLELNDLIEEYAPNLSELMEEDPDIKSGISYPDGSIYALPTLQDPDFLSMSVAARPYINKELLDDVNMDMPETTDEFYEYLKAVKEEDSDIIPYSNGLGIDDLVDYLGGSFGILNRGVRNTNIDKDPDGDGVRFYPITDEYKEMMEYLHKLNSEDLLDPRIFDMDFEKFIADGAEGKYASTIWYDPKEEFGEEVGEEYEPMIQLEGPHGDQTFTKLAPTVVNQNAVVITNKNENPAATVRWYDHFFSDEGAELMYMGIEGDTYEEDEDGEATYTEKITDNENGLNKDQAIAKYIGWVGRPAGLLKEDYYDGTESTEESIEAAEKLEPYMEEKIWPGFTYTEEENDFLDAEGADLEKYVEETRDKFINGDKSLSEWDEYVEQVEKLGLDEYMEIQEEAYERYKENRD